MTKRILTKLGIKFNREDFPVLYFVSIQSLRRYNTFHLKINFKQKQQGDCFIS